MKDDIPNAWATVAPIDDPAHAPRPHGNLEWHKRYDNIDGTGEMLMGLMLLGFGLLNYLQTVLPEHSIWRTNGFCSLLFMYAVLTLVLGPGYWLRRVIKKRITWPRTGYVAGHSFWRLMLAPRAAGSAAAPGVPTAKGLFCTMFAIAFVAAVVGAGVACLGAFQSRHLDAVSWLVGVSYVAYLGFWVLIYAFWVWRMGREHRWKWLVLLFMSVGLLVIGLTGPGTFLELARPVALFVGAVWVLSGLATLGSYLQHTHLPAPESE